MTVVAFLPCRTGSVRVKNKNTRVFAGYEYGLLELKIFQLLSSKYVDYIFLSTDEPSIHLIVSHLPSLDQKRIFVHQRSADLCSSKTTTDRLIYHAKDVLSTHFSGDTHVMWTHVTCPFFDSTLYDEACDQYFAKLNTFDSLMGVKKHQTFFWDNNKPLNYDTTYESWPFTQSIPPLFEVTSSIFISRLSNYHAFKDRIGDKPFFFLQSNISAIDIDWEDDFHFAEKIFLSSKS